LLALVDVPERLLALNERSRELARTLREALDSIGSDHSLGIGACALGAHPDSLVYVDDGVLKHVEDGRFVRYYTDDDLLITPRAPAPDTTLVGDFAARLRVCPRGAFEDHVLADGDLARAWLAHQQLQLRILHGLGAVYAREHIEPTTEIRRFAAGAPILDEGDEASRIYVLISGEARVRVAGIEVGRIHEMEVFGEMGFFTNQRRTASVDAIGDCVVQQIPREDFERLIRSRPQLAIGMLQTMTERVVALNIKIARP